MGRRSTGTVEVRQSCIRLKFTYARVRRVETLDLKPTPANIKAAERLLGRIRQAIEAGVYRREDFFETSEKPSSHRITFAEYAQEHQKTLVLAKSTRRTFATAVRSWLPYFGQTALVDLKHSDLLKARADRAKKVKACTLNNHLSALRSVLGAAVRDKLIKDNPADGVTNLTIQAAEPDPLTRTERDRVLTHMKDRYPVQIWAYYVIAFHTGVRPSEEIALTWSDIDWGKRTLRVSRARVDAEEKDTKTNRVRHVDLSDAAIAALEAMKSHTFMKGAQIFENPNTHRPWNDVQLQRRNYFAPTLRALKIRHRDAYETRHTFATTLLMAGLAPAYIARQLGHTTPAMLFTTYSKWIDGGDGGLQAQMLNKAMGSR